MITLLNAKRVAGGAGRFVPTKQNSGKYTIMIEQKGIKKVSSHSYMAGTVPGMSILL
jgi:hypothetical protein